MKKVLIISYYWPPSGGVGVLRNLKFVKYLRNYGWEPIVYAPSNADYSQIDTNNNNDIPEGVKILKQPIVEPFSLFRKFTGRKDSDKTNPVYARENTSGIFDLISIWIRGNFFIPDARSLWIKPSVKYLNKYLTEHKIDAILTDGPPHTNTVIGQRLSDIHKIPWLADFQDPWTQVDYYKLLKIGKAADKKHRKLEQATFQTASQITIASPTWAKDLESIGARDVKVIYYGYDEADFTSLEGIKPKSKEFTISHAGILGFDRHPDTFLKVLGDLCTEIPSFKEKLKLKLAGIVDFTVKESIAKHGLSENFIELGNIERVEALKLMLTTDLLLLPVNKAENAKGRLPGKIYEYLRAQKPILSLGIDDSDVQKILLETKTGVNYQYDDYNSIKSYVLKVFNGEYKQGCDTEIIEKFSCENQTKKLASLLDKITSMPQ